MITKKMTLILSLFALSLTFLAACDDDEKKTETTVAQCTDDADNDGDGLVDCEDPGCETACASLDADDDGVPDHLDKCPGHDDGEDADNDSIPDGCDICANGQDLVDNDEDGVPDDCDLCEGHDDAQDADEDGVPDGCDLCPGYDDANDSDNDGVADECDVCPEGDDLVDTDGDEIPDDCDDCPLTEECNVCYEACYYIEQECGYPNACAASGFDCTTEDDFCESACMLDASCSAIASLISQNPDPALSTCINECDPNNACTTCVGANCQAAFAACTNSTTCTAFLECSDACVDDPGCVDTCATTHASTETTNLQNCTCANCADECVHLCGAPN